MKKNLIPILLLFVITTLYFAPVVFFDRTFIARDHYIFFNPRRFFATETIQSGTLPLWNPYIACGVPFQANLQSSIFYPLSLIYYVLPFQKGFKYFLVLHYFLGSLCMFLLMRGWGNSRYAAFFSALVFSFGGYLVSINDNIAFVTAGIWLPLVLLCHHHALQSGSFFYALLTSITIGLQVLGGDASFCVLSTWLVTLLYTLFYPMINSQSHSSKVTRSWMLFVLSWILGLALAAVQLIPFAEFALRSTRFEGLSFELLTKWSFHPLELVQLLIPYAFGHIVPTTRWLGQFWLDTFYIGIFPLIFVVLYIFYGKDKIKYFLMILVLLGLFLSFGKYNPLFKYLHQGIPGANMLLFPVKYLFIASFAMSIMAGKGIQLFFSLISVRDSAQKMAKYIVVSAILLATLLLGGIVFRQEVYTYFLKVYPQTKYMLSFNEDVFFSLYKGLLTAVVLLGLFCMIILIALRVPVQNHIIFFIIITIVSIDLFFIGKPQDPYIDESLVAKEDSTIDFLDQDSSLFRIYSLSRIATHRSYMHLYNVPFHKTYRVIKESLPANLNIYHHIFSIDENSALLSKNFYEIFLPIELCFSQNKPASEDIAFCRRMLDLLNVKYVISPFVLKDFSFNLAEDGPIKIYENPTALPRAFFIQKLVVVQNEKDVLTHMKSPDFKPKEVAYVSQEESQKIQQKYIKRIKMIHTNQFVGSVNMINYRPNSVSLRTETNQVGFLILSDSYYPGWKAFVNQKEVPIVRVNHILRGILVNEGENYITFVFRPSVFFIGSLISLVMIAGIGISLLVIKKGDRRVGHKNIYVSGRFSGIPDRSKNI